MRNSREKTRVNFFSIKIMSTVHLKGFANSVCSPTVFHQKTFSSFFFFSCARPFLLSSLLIRCNLTFITRARNTRQIKSEQSAYQSVFNTIFSIVSTVLRNARRPVKTKKCASQSYLLLYSVHGERTMLIKLYINCYEHYVIRL